MVGETASWLLDDIKNRVLGYPVQNRATNVRREEVAQVQAQAQAQAQPVEDHSEDESEGRSETSSVKSEAVVTQEQQSIRMRTRARSKAS